MTVSAKRLLRFGGPFLVAAFVLWLTHDAGISLSDEGYVVNSALRVLRGEIPARDFPDPCSFIAYVVAFWFRIWGADLLAFRKLMIVFKAATAALTYACACRLTSRGWALVPFAATVVLSGPIFKAYTGFVFALCAWAAVVHANQPDRPRALLLGAAFGVAFLLRPDATLLLLAPLLAAARLLDRRLTGRSVLAHWPAAAAVFLAVILAGASVVIGMATRVDAWRARPWSAYTTFEGLRQLDLERLGQAPVRDLLEAPALFLYDTFVNVQGGYVGLGGGWSHPWTALTILWFIALAVPFWAVERLCRSWKPDRAAVLAVSLASLAKFLTRADASHLAQHIPSLSLTLCVAAFDARESRPRLSRMAPAVLLLAAAWASCVSRDIYLGGFGVLRDAERSLAVSGAAVRIEGEFARSVEELVREVSTRVEPGRTMLAVPNCPLLYLLCGLPAPLALSMEPGPSTRPDPERLRAMQDVLARRSVQALVLHKRFSPGMEVEPSAASFLALFGRISAAYTPVWENGEFSLYLRK